MRTTFTTMGTVASLEVPGEHMALVADVRELFERSESRFSLYRDDSELSLIASGRVTLAESSAELRDAYASALEWRSLTGGSFTPHRPDGVIDLNGLVKARAIAEAGALLQAGGCLDFTINVGGDILTGGMAPRAVPWRTGITDPAHAGDRNAAPLCSFPMTVHRAIATSGSAERGDHIWLARPESAPEFVQVSVLADDIETADVLATTIIAAGRDFLSRATANWDIDVLTVDRAGELLVTPGLGGMLRTAA